MLDGLHQTLNGRVALQNQTGIQTDLCAVRQTGGPDSGIERAERVAVASTVLIVALAGRDECQGRDISSCQVRIQTTRAFEANDVLQTIAELRSLLDTLEIGE